MDVLADLIKILIPVAAVLAGMFLTVRAFLQKEFEKRLIDMRSQNTQTILPVRLQAYERICLLLERINPQNLILRVNEAGFSNGMLHQSLIFEIRQEYNHNLSQQLYMSSQAWILVKNSVEDIIGIINNAAQHTDRDAHSVQLAKIIFENLIDRNQDPTERAMQFLKTEIQSLF